MEVRTIYTAEIPDYNTDLVMFNFNEKNPVSREVLAYTLLSLVAEVSKLSEAIKKRFFLHCLKAALTKAGQGMICRRGEGLFHRRCQALSGI